MIFLIYFLNILQLVYNQPYLAKQTTNLLDHFLINYNKYLRPDPITIPTLIHINFQITDITYNEESMMFTINFILNQWWSDPRLSYWNYFNKQKNKTYLPFDLFELTHKLASIKLPNELPLWKPDTYVLNSLETNKINQNKKQIRLFLDGTVLYSTKILTKIKCITKYKKFPHNQQQCPLHISSFSFSKKEITYRWTKNNSCTKINGLKLSQLNLINIFCSNKSKISSNIWNDNKTFRPVLTANLLFKPNIGYYFIEIYIPCVLIVMTSWSSFFINREATNVRVFIGSVSTFSIILLSIKTRLLFKSVPYFTALDYFMTISLTFIFASSIQYLFVHQNTKIGFGDIGTWSNWIPIDRLAKIFYFILKPEKNILKQNFSDSLVFYKNNRLSDILKNNNEPMIYDLPLTDRLDLIESLNNSLAAESTNSLNLKKQCTISTIEENLFSSFKLNESNKKTNKICSGKLDSIPEENLQNQLIESIESNVLKNSSNFNNNNESDKFNLTNSVVMNDFNNLENVNFLNNLSLLKQEQQINEQNDQINQLKNSILDLEYINNQNLKDSETKNQKKNFLQKTWSIFKKKLTKKSPELIEVDLDSINQLNSISQLDKICRLIFPILYLIFIIFYCLAVFFF